MVKETKIKKGRIRLKRGMLTSFYDLPFCARENFKKIALEMMLLDPSIAEVFVYGSYFWGSWDKDSDYDVRINQRFSFPLGEFKALMLEKYKIDADVMPHALPKKEMNLIKIPV